MDNQFEVPPVKQEAPIADVVIVDRPSAEMFCLILSDKQSRVLTLRAELQEAEAEVSRLKKQGEQSLEIVAREECARVGKKSVALGSMKLGFRESKTTLEVTDEEQFVEWATTHLPHTIASSVSGTINHLNQKDRDWVVAMMEETGALDVKVSKKIVKTPLNEYFKLTGKVPPGCKLSPATDNFYME